MKITPLEIRQKAFETVFRGYEKDEVDAFLLSLSQEWERVGGQMRDQQTKLETTEKELNRLREMESSLYKTLKTAEETSNSLMDQANKRAELQVKEAQMKADGLISEARNLAKDMIDEAEASIKDSFEILKDQVKSLEQDFKVLENHRETLISELKSLSSSILERAERSEKQKFTLNTKVDVARAVNIKEVLDPMDRAFNHIVKTKSSQENLKSQVAETKLEPLIEKISAEAPVLPTEEAPKKKIQFDFEISPKNTPKEDSKSDTNDSFFDLD